METVKYWNSIKRDVAMKLIENYNVKPEVAANICSVEL